MKKLLLIVIIVLGLGFYFFKSEPEVAAPVDTEPTTFKPNPSSATFTFDDGSITLSNGEGGQERDSIRLLEERAHGDLNADGKEDTVILLARSGGGSGVFIHIAAYVSGPVTYKGTNTVFLGDRISPKDISIDKGVVTVSFLDRDVDEPFAAEPTIPVSKQFVYKGGIIEEIK